MTAEGTRNSRSKTSKNIDTNLGTTDEAPVIKTDEISAKPETKKPGRPEEEKFDPYRHITEQQHRIALEAAFGLKEEYGYKDLETALVKAYMSVGVKLNHQKAVSLITMLRNKRMIVQENGRKYTFKPDFHY